MNLPERIAQFRKMATDDPENELGHFRLGQLLMDDSQFAEAAKSFERTLELTKGNREEAAKLLGIGERTLYRVIRDWKVQDQIKEALEATQGDLGEAAKRLNLSAATLQRKMKKLGLTTGG